jgi:alkyl hydroperoxide reductase subunit AhpC
VKIIIISIKIHKKEVRMALVGQKAPEFCLNAYDPVKKAYTTVKLSDYRGKFLVLCFYPADFTFVCPTEIAAVNAKIEEIRNLGADVLAVSTDTHFSHQLFCEVEPLLKDLKFPLAADPTGKTARDYGVYIEEEGIARRGRFIINPDGVIVAEEVLNPPVGRNVNELLRQLAAWKHVYENPDEACPANWRPGKKTLKPGPDIAGKVGTVITIDEILS